MARLSAPLSGRAVLSGRGTAAWSTFVLVLMLLVVAPTARAQEGPGGQPPPPPAVTVVEVAPQDVTLTARLPGRIVASAVAEVRPQV